MPTSVNELETQFNLTYLQSINWGTAFIQEKYGIYIISTNKDKNYCPESIQELSINESQLNIWLRNAPNILLNGTKPNKLDLINHLKGFWLHDETILYIGKAERQTLSERICQFYNHKVGKRSPHKGGYWLKLLTNLNKLYIHLYETKDSHRIEEELLSHFIYNVSEESKNNLNDKEICLPFANLELRPNVIKRHSLQNHYQ